MNKDNQEKFAELTAKWLVSNLKEYLSYNDIFGTCSVDSDGLKSDIKYKMERLFESLDDSKDVYHCPTENQLCMMFYYDSLINKYLPSLKGTHNRAKLIIDNWAKDDETVKQNLLGDDVADWLKSLDDPYEKNQCPSKEQLIKAFQLLKTRGCLTWDKYKNADEVIKHWDDDKVKTD